MRTSEEGCRALTAEKPAFPDRSRLGEDGSVRGKRLIVLLAVLLASTGSSERSARATQRRGVTASVPPGFHATGVSFVSETEGWVIGEAKCPEPICTFVLRTSDGGHRWEAVSAPDALGPTSSGRYTTTSEYVSDLRFADSKNGWAFYGELWATHDGGRSWHEIGLGNPVFALEVIGRRAYAVVGSCGASLSECTGPVRVYETPVGTDDWRSVLEVESPSHEGELYLGGRALYFTIDPGEEDEPPLLFALTPARRWERRTMPSSCEGGVLGPTSPRDLFLVCQTGEGVSNSGPHEFHVSSDGGKSWQLTWKSDGRSSYFGPIAITSEGRFLANASAQWLEIERRDGRHESFRFTASGRYSEEIRSLRFPTPRFGVVLTGDFLYLSTDAGVTWEPVHFRG